MSGLDRMGMSVNGPDNATSPATMIGKLQEAMQLYSSNPSNRNPRRIRPSKIRRVALVASLNKGSSEIQNMRADMDRQNWHRRRRAQLAAEPVREGQRRSHQRHADGPRIPRILSTSATSCSRTSRNTFPSRRSCVAKNDIVINDERWRNPVREPFPARSHSTPRSPIRRA